MLHRRNRPEPVLNAGGSWVLALLGLAAMGGAASGQTFVENTTSIPQGSPGNQSTTDNVDFADVDGDGDWDAAFADGGDQGNDQNRLWINQGPGPGTGDFVDETAVRCPSVLDQSRDVEFVDFDGDGDPDLYFANVASVSNQSSRWWHNVGGGFYADETATRWVDLGEAGSSIPPTHVMPSGGFIDFSGDGDFADLDNDGDLDLFHSSYGGVYSGLTPSRVFLNDGAGYFREFNPSGFQLPGTTIFDGDPGLWCEGVQQADTTNSDGSFCDVASTPEDIDLADVDGDFDIDVLHGARREDPRLFQNRLEENGGALGFRDVTGASFPANYALGTGHYEQEMGDLDGDGDLDIFGLNWNGAGGFHDTTLENDGSGVFVNQVVLASSSSDDEEGDFLDYDNDGDLDLYVANFSGQDRLYRNENDGGAGFSFTHLPNALPALAGITKDADACDVDGDGDYDLFTAKEPGAANEFIENVTQIPDLHGPRIPLVEQAPDRAPGPEPTVIRAHVYDNAPYYVTWYNPTELSYSVDGGSPQVVPMRSSGGQVFRGEIPGGIVGSVDYFVASRDAYGNSGQSTTLMFSSGGSGEAGTPVCFGDGTGGTCPCGNTGGAGEGCANSSGAGGALSASGSASVSAADLLLHGVQLPATSPGLYFQGEAVVNGGSGVLFGDGLRCAGGHVTRLGVVVASAGQSTYPAVGQDPVAVRGGATAGDTRYYQLWFRDPGGPCGDSFNTTSALRVDWTP